MNKAISLCLFFVLALNSIPAYPIYNKLFLSNAAYISMSQNGQLYSSINNNGIEIYKRVKNSYVLLTKFYLICSTATNCAPYRQRMTYDGSRILAYSSNDNTIMRVYKIINETVIFSQAIVGVSWNGFLVRQNYLLSTIFSSSEMFKYDSVSGLYQPIPLDNTTFLASSARTAFSSDGQYLVAVTSSLMVYVYSFNGTSFIQPAAGFQLSPAVSGVVSSLTDCKFQKLTSGSYSLLVSFPTSLSGVNRHMYHYSMSAPGVFTVVSQFDYFQSYMMHISSDGRFLMAAGQPSLMKMYEYDSAIDQFIFTHIFTDFYLGYPSTFYVSQNGSFAIGNKGGSEATLYFSCSVSFCVTCNTPWDCQLCASTFTLTADNLCTCSSSQTLINSTCVSCNVSQCSSCSAADVCAVCGNGFTLLNNSCICGSNGTQSFIDGSCVSCNITDCYRCDKTNVCALFVATPTTSLTQQVNTSTQQVLAVKGKVQSIQTDVTAVQNGVAAVQSSVIDNSGMSSTQIAVLTLLTVVLVAIIASLVYLVLKVSSLAKSLQKVNVQIRDTTPNEEPNCKRNNIMLCEGEEPGSTQLNYEPRNSTDLQSRPLRGRRRKLRVEDISQQQNVTMQLFVDKDLVLNRESNTEFR